jgi:hypothetical protein
VGQPRTTLGQSEIWASIAAVRRGGSALPNDHDAIHLTSHYERPLVPMAGHFLPRETPEAVVSAIEVLMS